MHLLEVDISFFELVVLVSEVPGVLEGRGGEGLGRGHGRGTHYDVSVWGRRGHYRIGARATHKEGGGDGGGWRSEARTGVTAPTLQRNELAGRMRAPVARPAVRDAVILIVIRLWPISNPRPLALTDRPSPFGRHYAILSRPSPRATPSPCSVWTLPSVQPGPHPPRPIPPHPEQPFAPVGPSHK